MAVISLIPDPEQAWGLALDVSPIAAKLIRTCWPGPLSIIFHASGLVPVRVQGAGGTVALRCPNDPLSLALLSRIGGPVVSSSANLSGQRPAETAAEVVAYFGNQLDLVLDGGPRRGGIPSTLVDVTGPGRSFFAAAHWMSRGCSVISTTLTGAANRRRLTRSKARAYPRLMASAEPAVRVLFVCTGNTCRSPLAAAALRANSGRTPERVEVSSPREPPRWEGQPASDGTRDVAARGGIDLSSHRSRRVTTPLVRAADFVFVMEPLHRVALEALGAPGGARARAERVARTR